METKELMNYEEEIEIDVKGILIELWRKLPLIILVGVLTAAIGFAYSSFVLTPTYQSSTQIFIGVKNDSDKATSYSDMQMGTLLTNDYAVLIKSRHVMEQVIEELQMDTTYAGLLGQVAISVPTSTRCITITVTDDNPVDAMRIANTIREKAAEHITNVMNIEAVNVVDEANLPTTKSGPSISKYTVLGGAAGVFLMCVIYAIAFIINDTVKTPDDVEKKLGLSVLAVVPQNSNIKRKRKKRNQ